MNDADHHVLTRSILMKVLLSVCLWMAIQPCFAESASEQDYDFKLGHWRIDAKAMKPDQSHDQGSGSGHVFRNQVGIIQDDLCIDMQQVPDAVGSTMRTLDPVKKIWHVTWVSYGSPSGSGTGTGTASDGTVVEQFPGSDEHGEYVDEMRFTLHGPDHYVAELSRTYKNFGYRLECVWGYEARRVSQPIEDQCGLLK